MAAINGDSNHTSESFGGLGKRKRTSSQGLEQAGTDISRLHNENAHQSVEAVLKLLRNYDPSSSLLNYPLHAASPVEPDTKRARLTRGNVAAETIESRVTAGTYTSLDEMVEDVERAASALLDGDQALSEQVNGESKPRPVVDAKSRAQIAAIRELVTKQLQRQKKGPAVKNESGTENIERDLKMREEDSQRPQILTLRAGTDRGPRQVYSGLQIPARSIARPLRNVKQPVYEHISGKTLPNGFDLAEATPLNAHATRKSPQPTRTFGDVFRPQSRLKELDAPRSSRTSTRNAPLEFVDPTTSLFERAVPAFKSDYKFERLPTSEWLQYAESEAGQKKRQSEHTKMKALFYTSYSSFAPTEDNSAAVISERDRSQQWWSRGGDDRFKQLFSFQYPDEEAAVITSSSDTPPNDEFASLVTEFETEELVTKAFEEPGSEPTDLSPDSLLEEVRELLATLSSYQRIRSLNASKAGASEASPSTAEFDTYEILKSQLSLLIESLPPFAVAKLDGDQLEQLNINTKILVDGVDFSGTGEVDDYTMQRRKAAAAAASAAARTTASATPVTARPTSYQSPSAAAAAAASYNPRARTYNPAIPPPNLTTYGSANSNPQSFTTPRPPSTTPRSSYPQQGYQQPATPSYQQPSVQQFQRPPLQNGYGSYSSSTPSQMSYLQRPAQPGYQQRAQETMGSYNNNMRGASPQKPVVNGQQYQQQPGVSPYPQQRVPGSTANVMQLATSDQRTRIEHVRAQQAQGQSAQPQLQRQSSGGTPNPQTPVGTYGNGTPQYDGADEGRATPGAGAADAGRDRSTSATAVSVDAQ